MRSLLRELDDWKDDHIQADERRHRELMAELKALTDLFQQSKGALKAIQVFAALAVPIGGFLLWGKDHIKW